MTVIAKTDISQREKECYVKNFGQGEKWLQGEIVKQKGPVTFEIKLQDGRIFQRHQDHVR